MPEKNKILLLFIINGEEVSIEANRHAPLQTAVNKALEQSGNTGRPPEDWGVYKDGSPLDAKVKIEDLGLEGGERLELSLKAAAGGCW